MIVNNRTWKHFISHHQKRDIIEESSPEVVTVLRSSPDDISKAEKLLRLVALQSSEATVLILLNPFNDKIMGSFLHAPFGIRFDTPAIEGQVKCIALTGFGEQATPIYLDVVKLFKTTEDAHPVPSLEAFLSHHGQDAADLAELTPSEGSASAINLVAVLPPSLTHVVMDQEDTDHPHILLQKTIDTIHAKLDEDDPEDTEPITHLYPILLTIWAFCHKEDFPDIFTGNAAATDSPALEWSLKQHKACLPQVIDVDGDENHTSSAIDRLASTIEASHSAAARFLTPTSTPDRLSGTTPLRGDREESSTSEEDLLKAWQKIPSVFRQGILFASTVDGLTAPAHPTEKLLTLVDCKSGTIVQRLIARWHARLDMTVQPGMATNISKGFFCSQPDAMEIDTFSPFFVPPSRAGFQNMSNDELNSLELSSKTFNLSQSNIKKMTKCKPFIPRDETTTMDMVKNYTAIVKDIFGEDSIWAHRLLDLQEHYECNKLKYHRCFKSFQWFGLWLLDRVHFKHQSFLHSCFVADSIEEVDKFRYSLTPEMEAIDHLTFRADPPAWPLPLIKAPPVDRTSTTQYNDNNSRRSSGHSQHNHDAIPTRFGQVPNKRTKAENNILDPEVALKQGERYSSLIHFRNLEKCKSSAVKLNGEFICNNWHIRGHCFPGCCRSATHVPLSSEVKGQYRAYVEALRQCQSDFQNQATGNSGRHPNTNRTRNITSNRGGGESQGEQSS